MYMCVYCVLWLRGVAEMHKQTSCVVLKDGSFCLVWFSEMHERGALKICVN